jgi:hypothetical protein
MAEQPADDEGQDGSGDDPGDDDLGHAQTIAASRAPDTAAPNLSLRATVSSWPCLRALTLGGAPRGRLLLTGRSSSS